MHLIIVLIIYGGNQYMQNDNTGGSIDISMLKYMQRPEIRGLGAVATEEMLVLLNLVRGKFAQKASR